MDSSPPAASAAAEPASSTASPGGSRRKRILVKLGLVAASGVFALGMAEVAVRVAGIHVPPRGDAGTQGIMRSVAHEDAPHVAFELKPGIEVETSYPGAPGEEPRVVTYRINEHGFRGSSSPTPTIAKPDGVVRIVALGDSFTYGTGVDSDETWPHLVEQELRKLLPDTPIEVLNWGVPAYNSRQQVGQLNQRVKAYQPDVVLLCAYINDASGENRVDGDAPAEVPWEVRWNERLGLTSGRWGDEAPKTPAQARTMWWRERSRLVDVAAWKLHGWLMSRVAGRNYVDDWEPGSKGHAMVKNALSGAAVLARRESFDLVAMMYPDIPSLGSPYAFARQHAAFGALCEEIGIPFHDLVGVFDGADKSRLQAHAHDKHPNGAANAMVARHVAQLLVPVIEGR